MSYPHIRMVYGNGKYGKYPNHYGKYGKYPNIWKWFPHYGKYPNLKWMTGGTPYDSGTILHSDSIDLDYLRSFKPSPTTSPSMASPMTLPLTSPSLTRVPSPSVTLSTWHTIPRQATFDEILWKYGPFLSGTLRFTSTIR